MKETSKHIDGVFVESVYPDEETNRPPLLFLHGGSHGSWVWKNYLNYFGSRNWECHAPNYFNHYGSKSLDNADFVTRSVAHFSEEIHIVAETLEQKPILIGHSMGGLVALAYAQVKEVQGLILLAPCVPAGVGAAPSDFPVDFSSPYPPPPFEMAYNMFFMGLAIPDAKKYYKLLCPESSQAVWEITRHTLSIDFDAIKAPTLIISGEHDMICPTVFGKNLAERLGAKHLLLRDTSHNLVLDPFWSPTAKEIEDFILPIADGEIPNT